MIGQPRYSEINGFLLAALPILAVEEQHPAALNGKVDPSFHLATLDRRANLQNIIAQWFANGHADRPTELYRRKVGAHSHPVPPLKIKQPVSNRLIA